MGGVLGKEIFRPQVDTTERVAALQSGTEIINDPVRVYFQE
jgi:hypothetical protein